MEKQELTCIVCPMGCSLEVTLEDGKVLSVKGNGCPRGEAYGKNECTHPTRVLTTTMAVTGGKKPVVSVKTAGAIPKELLFEAMTKVNGMSIPSPIQMGQVLIPDLCGTGIDLVATGTVEKA